MTATGAALTRVSHPIVLVWGWRRAAVAFGAGGLSALAMAPFNAWPLLFVTFPVLVWLLDGSVAGRLGGILPAAAVGWWFGFGYFLAGLYWIGFAFLVDADVFGWLLPFAVLGLPAGLALFTALGTALARMLWTRGALRVLTLAVCLTAVEWLRGHVLTGFPWNAFGYALTSPLILAQSAALVGIWSLTLFAVFLFASPAVLADDHIDTRRRFLPLVGGLVILAAMAVYGGVRLAQAPTSYVPGVRLRIMQPNLSQDAKFNYAAKPSVMRKYLELSERATSPQSAGVKDVTHLIWPEAAFPFFLVREPDALAQIADLLPPGTVLITGAVRPAGGGADDGVRAYNSIYVIDHDGSLLATYDKLHLVPFGEYLPFQDTLESLGLMQLTQVRGGFIAGERRRPLSVPRAPSVLPLICYEIIFPGEVSSRAARPGWIVNLTNDGWFGNSSGPYQHFQQAQVRAIEEGLPVVRAANTGISAIIDPLGRIEAALPLGSEGVLDGRLPRAIPATPYVRWGDLPSGAAFVAALIVILRRRLRLGRA
jgi:apolipoprotein N-acyltransferase